MTREIKFRVMEIGGKPWPKYLTIGAIVLAVAAFMWDLSDFFGTEPRTSIFRK